ncbi:hypothetical protein JRQ81_017084 [Phrynocephalus forsythii]|uniref:Uncharacterized protein n=1 Tax=Phrynocephalus forsythii TaxID=171643 RepID=A0A9Q0XTJ7_9SAUR|nr:hypothetical protein JRQ81_017084 [Phrynocephalus forsythii]
MGWKACCPRLLQQEALPPQRPPGDSQDLVGAAALASQHTASPRDLFRPREGSSSASGTQGLPSSPGGQPGMPRRPLFRYQRSLTESAYIFRHLDLPPSPSPAGVFLSSASPLGAPLHSPPQSKLPPPVSPKPGPGAPSPLLGPGSLPPGAETPTPSALPAPQTAPRESPLPAASLLAEGDIQVAGVCGGADPSPSLCARASLHIPPTLARLPPRSSYSRHSPCLQPPSCKVSDPRLTPAPPCLLGRLPTSRACDPHGWPPGCGKPALSSSGRGPSSHSPPCPFRPLAHLQPGSGRRCPRRGGGRGASPELPCCTCPPPDTPPHPPPPPPEEKEALAAPAPDPQPSRICPLFQPQGPGGSGGAVVAAGPRTEPGRPGGIPH